MTKSKILFHALGLFLIFSCGSEEKCTPESIAGTYNYVSSKCESTEDIEIADDDSFENSELFTIKAVDENTISIEGDDGNPIELVIDGCEFASVPISIEFFGINITSSYSGIFEGDQFTLNISSEVSAQLEDGGPVEQSKTTCMLVASK